MNFVSLTQALGSFKLKLREGKNLSKFACRNSTKWNCQISDGLSNKSFQRFLIVLPCLWSKSLKTALCSSSRAKSQKRNHSISLETAPLACNIGCDLEKGASPWPQGSSGANALSFRGSAFQACCLKRDNGCGVRMLPWDACRAQPEQPHDDQTRGARGAGVGAAPNRGELALVAQAGTSSWHAMGRKAAQSGNVLQRTGCASSVRAEMLWERLTQRWKEHRNGRTCWSWLFSVNHH